MFRKVIHTLFGMALVGMAASASVDATMNVKKTTYFTFSKAVQLPGVVLPAGAYVFEVVNPFTGSDVVSVRRRDNSKVYALQLTTRVERPAIGDLKPIVKLGETPSGNPPAIRSWFADGQTSGRAFIY